MGNRAHGASAAIRFGVLGPLEVTRGGESIHLGSPKQRAVLGILLTNSSQVVSTDRLIDEIWGDDAAPERQNALWVHISNLRKSLEPENESRSNDGPLQTRSPGYALDVEAQQVDSRVFEKLLAEGRALTDTDPAAASILFAEALALWRGSAYADFVYEPWAQAEISRLEELRLEAVESRIDADLRRGMTHELVGELESLVRQHPTRERLAGAQMLTLYRSGRAADAMHSYRLLRGRLGEELGVEPSATLQRLNDRIVTSDPSLDSDHRAARSDGGVAPGLSLRGYEIRERLGERGSGVLYTAFQPAVGREVVIKVIRPDLADDPAFIRRFEDEAQLVARLEHPHIVPLYDYWREPGAAYLVMRYMRGGTLADIIADGPLSSERVATLVDQIGAALETAHRGGVTHGSIGPNNILVDDSGNTYLADFEIASAAQVGARVATGSTRAVAPSEFGSGGDVDPAADVYSLAVTVAQAITGRTDGISDLFVGLDGPLAAVLQRATDDEIAIRFDDAGAFRGAVATALRVGGEQTTPVIDENPYKGLRSFGQGDARDFFGRQRFIDRLVSRLGGAGSAGRFVAVVGPSGSGKSSVVRAGLLPALRQGAAPGSSAWFTVEMVPAAHPFEQLERALLAVAVKPPTSLLEQLSGDRGIHRAVERVLPEEHSTLVLVIDQFEELFTQSAPDEAERFIDALVDSVRDDHSRVRVVATLRADFYDRPLGHRGLGELLRNGTEVLTPMTPEDLERAVSGPAERVGAVCEPALVGELVAAVIDRPAALPLLQYTLTELFERRSGNTLLMSAYRGLGGVSGALVDRAEAIYVGLEPDEQRVARQVFLRLVTLGEGSGDTRRRVPMSELAAIGGAGPYAQRVTDTFARHRLLGFDRDPVTRGPTVEIAHEALLREWPRLQRWISEDRDGVRLVRRLTTSTAEWNAADRHKSELYRGTRLGTVEEWAEEHETELSPAERAFLDASRAQRDAEASFERRRVRRLRSLLATVAVIAIVALIAGTVAMVQRREAETNAREADLRRVMAESQIAIGDDPARALLLALEAYRLDPSTETLGTIVTAGGGSPTAWLGDIANGKSYRDVAFLDDALVVASNDESIEVWDVADRVMLRERPIAGLITDIELSADRQLVAAGSADGSWSVLTASDLEQVTGGRAESGISVIRIDTEHDVVALGLINGRVQIESITGESAARLLDAPDDEGEDPVSDVSLSSDGQMVAAAWGLGVVARQWDLDAATTSGRPLRTHQTLGLGCGSRPRVCLTPELVLYADGVLHIAGFEGFQSFDPESGDPLGEARELPGVVGSDARMTSAGSVVQIVGGGQVVYIDQQSDMPFERSYETGTTTAGGAISPDGRVAAFAKKNGLTFWAQNGAGLFVDAIVPADANYTQFNAISTDGRTVVQGGNILDAVSTSIWSLAEGDPTLVMRFDPGKGVRQFDNDIITFEPSELGIRLGHWDAVASWFAPLIVADFVTSGAAIPAFTPDGKQFLHPWAQGQGVVDVYDVESGRRLHRLTDVEEAAPPNTSFSSAPKFSADGRRLVYPTQSEYVATYDTVTWELLELLDASIGFSHLAFTPDGIHAITLSSRGLELRDATDLRSVLLGPVPNVDDPSLGRVLEISTDGRYLKTGGLTGAQLWDPTTLEPIGEPFPHDRDAWAATLAAETNQLATVVDGATLIWNIDLDEWPELACRAASRNLTREEWEAFGPRGEYHATCDRWPSG